MSSAVLSHAHYDHGGGLPGFFGFNSAAKVYLKKPPNGDCYFRARLLPRRFIGLSKGLFEKYSSRFEYIDEFREILPGVYVFADIGNLYPKPEGNRYLYIKDNDNWHPDNFAHELILAIMEAGELVIFTGCSHNGVINMIDTVEKKFNRINIKAVIGGFHLAGLPRRNTMAGSKKEINSIARKMLDYPVKTFYTGHCTGQKAYSVLKGVLGEKLQHLHTGAILEF